MRLVLPRAWRLVRGRYRFGGNAEFAFAAVHAAEYDFGLEREPAFALRRQRAVGNDLLTLLDRRAGLELDRFHRRQWRAGHGGHGRHQDDQLFAIGGLVGVDVVALGDEFKRHRAVTRGVEQKSAFGEEGAQFSFLGNTFGAEGHFAEGAPDGARDRAGRTAAWSYVHQRRFHALPK